MTKIHYWRRFFKGLFITLSILLSYKKAKLVVFFLSPEASEAYYKKLNRKKAALIRTKAIEMKGLMIKVGQFLSSRVDFLPEEFIAELAQLQDSIPPHEYSAIKDQIAGEFGYSPEEIFSEFDSVPVAAASLGQVHKAVLKDGRKVAVKVQYPEIDRIIETDIRMFYIVTKLLRGRYGKINLAVLHAEFSRIVRAELDYIREGTNAERFRANFKDDHNIIIPSVEWEYTKKKVLTLEYVEGIKITDCNSTIASGIDCREVVNLLAEAYSRMIFLHGFFHGDPHPGNIFIQEGPKLVFVDFGMVQVIPEGIKRELRRFANFLVESNTSGILETMERMGFILQGADYQELADVAQSLIDKYRNINPEEMKALTVDDIANEIENIISIVHYIQIPNNFILLGRSVSMLNGIAFSLNPDINIIEIGKPYIKKFLAGSGEEQAEQFLAELQKKALQLWRLPSQIEDFFVKANRGELSFKLSKSEVQGITVQIKAMTNVMLLIILAVTSATSALFFVLLENKQLALVAAGASIILGLLSVFRLLRR
jgi:ubiquinone biosynthesis protein